MSDELTIRDKLAGQRTHLANERTFLAWVRTSLALMAFGFVLERFHLYLRALVPQGAREVPALPLHVLGYICFGTGVLLFIMAAWRFLAVRRGIARIMGLPEEAREVHLPSNAFVFILVVTVVSLAGIYIVMLLR